MKILNYSLFAGEKRRFLCLAWVFLIELGSGRLPAQTLFGTVRESGGGPIAGAVLELQPERAGQAVLSAATDSAGRFVFEGLRPGYYRCTATAPGYESQVVPEVLMAAGKDRELAIELPRGATALPAVTITASALPGGRPFRPLSEIPLTREQTLRFPATFFDPARLAMAYPGVAGADDQANGLVIRGNGPGALRWRLEGVDIVNPNHLTNAGTFGDRPALASGGVLLFSAQLLDNSSLLTGAFPAGYGDALGGIMDIGLRRGNPYRHEFTAQAGLIGLDLAAEGPLGRSNRHSYLVNYRYSTVGLLGQMGISFGDEAIDFQDLSFKFSFVGKNGGQWSLFGVGGLNENRFARKRDSSEITVYKDLFDIDFQSRTGIIGLSNTANYASGLWTRAALVLSGQRNERRSEGAGQLERDWQDETRGGLSFAVGSVPWRRLRPTINVNVQNINYRLYGTTNDADRFRGEVALLLTQLATTLEWQSAQDRWSAVLGLHTVLANRRNAETGAHSPEPRLAVSFRPAVRHRLTAAYGRHSQLAPLWAYAVGRWPADTLAGPAVFAGELPLMKADHLNLGYRWGLSTQWTLRAEAFYQWLFDLPSALTDPTFSLLNVSEIQPLAATALDGRGRNYGLEFGAERYLSGGWFLLANTTLFDAETRGADGRWRESRWNARYIANLTAGREWQRDVGQNRTRAFGLNGRVTANGGFCERPIDVPASEAAQTTVFDEAAGFSIQQPGFFRVDLRVYWRRSIGGRRNSTFAMDFQNATFGQNIAYRYYDPYTRRVETRQQLGLIPNLSWRVEF